MQIRHPHRPPNQDGSLFQPLHEELNGPPRIAAILYNGPWVAGYSETVKKMIAVRVLGIVALATFATQVLGEDDFPIVGTYTENTPCTGDGPNAARVTITAHEIDFAFGLCAILSRQREGPAFAVRVQCKSPDGTQMLGDVSFTPRDDKTIDFSDLHQTYKATLYKCRD